MLVHESEVPHGNPVTVGDLKHVIELKEFPISLFPHSLKFVFKTKGDDGERVERYLYLAWSAQQHEEYQWWQDVLKRKCWRSEVLGRAGADEEDSEMTVCGTTTFSSLSHAISRCLRDPAAALTAMSWSRGLGALDDGRYTD